MANSRSPHYECPNCHYPAVRGWMCPNCHSVGHWYPIEMLTTVALIGIALLAIFIVIRFSGGSRGGLIEPTQVGVASAAAHTPTVTETPLPTSTPVPHTPTAPIATARPTNTRTPKPTVTLTKIPTKAPTKTPNPTKTATPTPTVAFVRTIEIGRSVRGTPIHAVEFGDGTRHIVLIGGIHAGFSPVTVTIVEEIRDYFNKHPTEIPPDTMLHIILNASPDSLLAPGEIDGRLNANAVDLNRNWECNWKESGVWRSKAVSGGSAPFSEPEVLALHDYLLALDPVAVIFWEAQMPNGLVSPGGCGERSKVSQPLANLYGDVAGYEIALWDYYEVNGDAANWLDDQNIPAIFVFLPDYITLSDEQWQKNLWSIQQVLEEFER